MEDLSAVAAATFARNYQLHLKHLTLKGLQPKTVEAYSRAIRRLGAYFDQRIDALANSGHPQSRATNSGHPQSRQHDTN